MGWGNPTPMADLKRRAAETAKLRAQVQRVLDLCDHWDKISKGESGTTRQIRAAIASITTPPEETT